MNRQPIGTSAEPPKLALSRGGRLSLRPAQSLALSYCEGRMGISAVPGAGKTFILTQLVVRLVLELGVLPEQILVVTYMRSAALNFRQRISAELAKAGRSARGLQTATIHSFCHGILSKHACRFTGSEDLGDGLRSPSGGGFAIAQEADQIAMLLEGSRQYRSLPEAASMASSLGDDRGVVELARRAITAAKQSGTNLIALADRWGPEIAFLARFYQQQLAANRLWDYDDLVVEAIGLLESDLALRAYYRDQIRYVLEDEAQDSTLAQNRLLELLAGRDGNLIRVGDANQAIMGSFTANDPAYFRNFCASFHTVAMNESSRSAPPILALANRLVEVAQGHPDPEIGRALGGAAIAPASSGPANPLASTCEVHWQVYQSKLEEISTVLSQVRRHLRTHPHESCAILCFSNSMIESERDGSGFGPQAKAMGLNTSQGGIEDRGRATALLTFFDRLLEFTAVPTQGGLALLVDLTFCRTALLGVELRTTKNALRKALEPVELADLVFPRRGLRPARPAAVKESTYAEVLRIAEALEHLLALRFAPLDELLHAAATLLLPSDLMALHIAHRLAAMLGRGRDRARLRIAELLSTGAASKLLPSGEPEGPRPGEVVITTLHRSKGAEYDAVWIPNAGFYYQQESYFPWQPDEVHPPEPHRLVAHGEDGPGGPDDPLLDYQRSIIQERLRLLYVGVTRARRVLTLSCYAYGNGPVAPDHVLELARGMDP